MQRRSKGPQSIGEWGMCYRWHMNVVNKLRLRIISRRISRYMVGDRLYGTLEIMQQNSAKIFN